MHRARPKAARPPPYPIARKARRSDERRHRGDLQRPLHGYVAVRAAPVCGTRWLPRCRETTEMRTRRTGPSPQLPERLKILLTGTHIAGTSVGPVPKPALVGSSDYFRKDPLYEGNVKIRIDMYRTGSYR